MRRILEQERIVARDQNKVFVERAASRKLSPSDAEKRYGMDPGKGNAYVELDVQDEMLHQQYNRRLKLFELFIVGDIDLTQRNIEARFNM